MPTLTSGADPQLTWPHASRGPGEAAHVRSGPDTAAKHRKPLPRCQAVLAQRSRAAPYPLIYRQGRLATVRTPAIKTARRTPRLSSPGSLSSLYHTPVNPAQVKPLTFPHPQAQRTSSFPSPAKVSHLIRSARTEAYITVLNDQHDDARAMNRSILLALLLVACTAPAAVLASKTCRGVCSGGADVVLCKGGCGVTKGLCKAQDGLCVAGCSAVIFKKPRRRCLGRCRRKTVEPCKRALVNRCRSRCERRIVGPCERRCKSALPKVCRTIMGAVPRNVLIQAARSKGACTSSSIVVGAVASASAPLIGLSVGPKGAVAGAVVGGAISGLYPEACKAVRDAKTDSEFKSKVCTRMGF